jgi:hypothetical protein
MNGMGKASLRAGTRRERGQGTGRRLNRIGTPADWLARALVAVGLVVGVVLATAPAVHAGPVNPAAAQQVVFSVSDGTSHEVYRIRECGDPEEPGCRIRRVPGQITFRVTIDVSLCCRDITVQYRTADGGARAPEDYNAVSGTLTFPPGVFSKSIIVRINEGGGTESTETFRFRLSNANVSADVSDAGIGTILDGVEDL